MANQDLLAKALAVTTENVVKKRGGGTGRTTYVDRIVSCLLDEDGNPTEPKTRVQIISEVSLEILLEERAAAIEADEEGVVEEFSFDSEADCELFAKKNELVKKQVATAVSNSQNQNAISFNDSYKDVWTVVKEGKAIALEAKDSE